MPKKYYVVWDGYKTGIFDSWDKCQEQIKGFSGAKFKSFKTKEAAEAAFKNGYSESVKDTSSTPRNTGNISRPVADSIAVDAACSGNPGVMEYQGVYVKTGETIFYKWYNNGTNNIGEFLALVHALALLTAKNKTEPVYSDSTIAIKWVQNKKCKSKFTTANPNSELVNIIKRAEDWLKNNTYKNSILKWDTENWGEIPADFGRK